MSTDPKPVELTEAEMDLLLPVYQSPSFRRWPRLLAVIRGIVAAHEAAARREALLEAADDLEPLVDNQHSAALNPDAWLRDRAEEIPT